MEGDPGIRTRLGSDRVLEFSLAAAVLLVVFYVTPLLGYARLHAFDEFLSGPLTLALVLLALFAPTGREVLAEERRFWRLLTVGYGFWFLAQVTQSLSPHVEGLAGGVALDSLYLLFYLSVILAAETRPHLRQGWTRGNVPYRLEAIGTVVFALGLLAYFVLIPSDLKQRVHGTLIPSYLLFGALDVYLAVRFVVLAREARSARFKAIFGLLGATALLWTATDMLEALDVAALLVFDRASALSLAWYTHSLTAIAAARLKGPERAAPPDAREGRQILEEQIRPSVGGTLVGYAFVFPIVHFGLYAVGLLGPVGRSAREVLVLVVLCVLSGLALAVQRHLDRKHRQLQRELQEVSDQLQRARRLEAIGRLASGVAHDFNNLLAAIRGSADLLRIETGDRREAVRLCDTIAQATEQAGGLTRGLLAFGRQQPLKPRVLDLNRVVEEAGLLLEGILGRRITCRTSTRSLHRHVRIDPVQINQVLLNFAVNARDAMHEGGVFTVETWDEHVDREGVDAGLELGPGDYVVLQVSDTGIGMTPQTMEQIFEPFYTTKDQHRGTGLGLATVYGVIKQSGGVIRVRSRLGAGSSFTVFLPRAEPSAEPADQAGLQAEVEPPPAVAAAETVLVVDDEPTVLDLVGTLLCNEGYSVLRARTGSEALEIAGAHAGAIDLLLTDVMMPELLGSELALRIGSSRPETKVLYMSGYTGPRDPVSLDLASGPVLRKPFSRQEMLQRIRTVLGSPPAPAHAGATPRVVIDPPATSC